MEGFVLFLIFAGVMLIFSVCTRGGPDKARDTLCAGLQTMGLPAQLAAPGRREEETGTGSLGVIEIACGPIRWINVRKEESGESTVYITEYGIPDKRRLPELSIRPIRVKTIPVFGRVTQVRWTGDNSGLGIAQRLSDDTEISRTIMQYKDKFTVVARGDFGCWLISRETSAAPTVDQWRCYQRIAGKLVATPVGARTR